VLPNPLHPAVVHLPIALTLLVPVFAAVALWTIHRGAAPLRAWGVTVALLAALAASAFVSLKTGEQQEDRVERVVGERPIETHEEAAEAFLVAAAAVLGVGLVGLVRGRVGTVARGVAAAGTLALVGAGWNVGRSGGELVYRHGAATAYLDAPAATADAGPVARESAGGERDEH